MTVRACVMCTPLEWIFLSGRCPSSPGDTSDNALSTGLSRRDRTDPSSQGPRGAIPLCRQLRFQQGSLEHVSRETHFSAPRGERPSSEVTRSSSVGGPDEMPEPSAPISRSGSAEETPSTFQSARLSTYIAAVRTCDSGDRGVISRATTGGGEA